MPNLCIRPVLNILVYIQKIIKVVLEANHLISLQIRINSFTTIMNGTPDAPLIVGYKPSPWWESLTIEYLMRKTLLIIQIHLTAIS